MGEGAFGFEERKRRGGRRGEGEKDKSLVLGGFVSIVSHFRELHESTVAVVTGGLGGEPHN